MAKPLTVESRLFVSNSSLAPPVCHLFNKIVVYSKQKTAIPGGFFFCNGEPSATRTFLLGQGSDGPPSIDRLLEVAKDPINVATGNVYSQYMDMTVAGTGLPIEIARTYNSKSNYEGPLGFGWTHSYNIYIEENEDNQSVDINDGSGALIIFEDNGDGTYTPPTGNYSELSKNTDGCYTLTTKYGYIEEFNPEGKLSAITDRNGNQLVLEYDDANLISITNPSGRQVTFDYDTEGRITSVTDSGGRTVSYDYDDANNLSSVTDQMGNVTEYIYKNFKYQHLLLSITDPMGHESTFSYDDECRGEGFSYENGNNAINLEYDPDNEKTIVTDSRGNETVYYYTEIANNRVITKIEDADGETEEYFWDDNLNKYKIIDANGNTTEMEYDDKGNMLSLTDPKGNTSSFAYEPVYNLCTSLTDPMGHQTSSEYDNKGNLTRTVDAAGGTVSTEYDEAGNPTSTVNPLGGQTTFAYDNAGNLTSVCDPLNNYTMFAADEMGNILTITDARGNETSFEYDALDRAVAVTYADGSTVRNGYDAKGNLISSTDTGGSTTEYEYDTAGRLEAVNDALSNTTRFGYDTEGNRLSITDANKQRTSYNYDELNRLVKVMTALGYTSSMKYDAVGNQISGTDANGDTTEYQYDENNQLTSITFEDGSSISYEYDESGRCITMTDSSGTTTYTYDDMNRLIEEDGPFDQDTISYTYDAAGNRIGMTDQDGDQTIYQYDQLNRLTEITDPRGETTTYEYDELSNLVATTYPNQTSTTCTFDNMNRLLNMVNRGGKDNGVISSYDYTYDTSGMRTGVTLANGDSISYSYDSLYRLTSEIMRQGKAGGDISYSANYEYDATGNRISMNKAMSNAEYVYEYTYDEENRLLAVNTAKVTKTIPQPSGNLNPTGEASQTAAKTKGKAKDGEILVKFKEGTSAKAIEEMKGKSPGTSMEKLGPLDVYRIKLPKGTSVDQALAEYSQSALVEYAEANYEVKALQVPNDPSYVEQWGLNNTGQNGGTAGADISAEEAWDIQTGSSETIVAVIDTGVQIDHPDLAGRFVDGYDFVNRDSDPSDDHGHGTFCTGIIAANSNNEAGVAGINWNAKIMPLKVLDAGGAGDYANVAEAVTYAADNGADVISLSLGARNQATHWKRP